MNDRRSKFLIRNSGLYSNLEEEGIWEVFGEDPNADWAGYHHQPSLGLFKGKLDKVIDVAVELPGFWQWGAGGKIEKRTIRNVS